MKSIKGSSNLMAIEGIGEGFTEDGHRGSTREEVSAFDLFYTPHTFAGKNKGRRKKIGY